MSKFKMRKGKLREYDHCIQCWRKSHPIQVSPSSPDNTTGALFDVIGGIKKVSSISKYNKLSTRDCFIGQLYFQWQLWLDA